MRSFAGAVSRVLCILMAAGIAAGCCLLPASAWQDCGRWFAALADEVQPAAATSATSTAPSEATTVPSTAATLADDEVDEQNPAVSVMQNSVPPKGNGGGTVIEEVVAGGTHLKGDVYYKDRDGVGLDYAAFLDKKLSLKLTPSASPQVLIVHTHTTESYMSYYAGYYNKGDLTRTTDAERNLVVVGEVLANRLRAAGIATVHATEVHDSPQYIGAYYRSEETIEKYRKQYPSIQLVIDLHRDAIGRSDTVKIKPTATVNGEKCAQMMLLVCASSADTPYRNDNVTLGLQLQQHLAENHPDLMRPITFCEMDYNQHLSRGFLVEVGTEVNTFEEAMRSAALLGDGLVALLASG